MLKLQCVAQTYEWGVRGPGGSVGRLFALSSGKEAEGAKPYAEFWMGTHPSGPSYVFDETQSTTMLLKDYIAANPDVLGEKVKEVWKGKLPFLFKVLSVEKALSIQAHPDKKLAETLHATQPENYKDDNHKPEMALAVTPFEALCGFVTSDELREALVTVPELRAAVGEEEAKAVDAAVNRGEEAEKDALKAAFKALMTRDAAVVSEKLQALVTRLSAETRDLNPKEKLVLRLSKQYPGDVGVFCAFFLNLLTLAPGQAIFLAANEPHAYLSGECVECMATSDNVVRAGLTPKFRDVQNLCSMLTYQQGPPEVLKGESVDEFTTVYTPPFDEFEVERVVIPLGKSAKLPVLPGPSILLGFKGNAAVTAKVGQLEKFVALKGGEVYFVPYGVELDITAPIEAEGVDKSDPEVQLYRARVHARIFGG